MENPTTPVTPNPVPPKNGAAMGILAIVVVIVLIIIGFIYMSQGNNTAVSPYDTTATTTSTEQMTGAQDTTTNGTSVTASTSVKTYPDNGVNGS